MIGRFFAGVGAPVRSTSDGRYLLLKRTADKDFAAEDWECVTGRVDQGEGFTDAVRREGREELGVRLHVDFIVGTIHFYRGEVQPENELVGAQFCCSIENPEEITASWEHAEHRWLTAEEASAFLPHGHWLARLIRRAETLRPLSSTELMAYYRETSFEV